MNTNKNLSNIYNNIYEYINYRNLQPIDKKLSNVIVNEIIQSNKYIIIRAINKDFPNNQIKELEEYLNKFYSFTKTKKKITDPKNALGSRQNIDFENLQIINIILLHDITDYASKTVEFKKLISLVKYPFGEIIAISKTHFSAHVNKQIVLLSTNNCEIFNYPYSIFSLIVPNHILTPKHKLLTNSEVEELINKNLICNKNDLPIMRFHEPMRIWIGGKVNQIVEIERPSEVTLLTPYYRIIKK